MNTLSTESGRRNYLLSQFDIVLRNALISEKICDVRRGDEKTVDNPYGGQPTATIQAVVGTYSVTAWTTTDDTLTVADEVIYAEHVFAHEEFFSVFDITASRLDNMMYAVAFGVDKFVLNNLCEDATGAYSTPAGGFTSSANINTIIANLVSKVAGYETPYHQDGGSLFLVIENTDLVGFMIAGMTNGYAFADGHLNNGWLGQYGGVDVHVVRSGLFSDSTLGSTTVTNSGHRVFGVKGVSTMASPRGLQYEEKPVTGKTGREIVVFSLIGFKLWAQKAGLIVDITLV